MENYLKSHIEIFCEADVTDHIKPAQNWIVTIKYTVLKSGLTAILCLRNETELRGTVGVYSIGKLKNILDCDLYFKRHAEMLGISREYLGELIISNAPKLH